jgi:hypothetical protein
MSQRESVQKLGWVACVNNEVSAPPEDKNCFYKESALPLEAYELTHFHLLYFHCAGLRYL